MANANINNKFPRLLGYVKNISYSQVTSFTKDTWEWVRNRVFNEYDMEMSVSAAVGTAAHKFVEVFLNTKGNYDKALDKALDVFYEWPDGYYVIDIDSPEISSYMKEHKDKKIPFEIVYNHFRTKKIDFGKTWSYDSMIKKLQKAVEHFIENRDIIKKELEGTFATEVDMLYKVQEKIDDVEYISALPFKAIADIVGRTTETMNIIVDENTKKEIKEGSLFIEDLKFKDKFSDDMDLDNPYYFIQAFFLYYTTYLHYWEKPKFVRFREIKISTNKNWESHHRSIYFYFEGETFEKYKKLFWSFLNEMYIRMEFELMRTEESNFVYFNIFDNHNATKQFQKMKELFFMMSEGQKVKNMGNKVGYGELDFNPALEWVQTAIKNKKQAYLDSIKENEKEDDNMPADVAETIRIALRSLGFIVSYVEKAEGYTYDLYKYTPRMWTNMTLLGKKTQELEQAIWVNGVNILTPIPWTKYIWVEVPRAEEQRKFLLYKDFKLEEEDKGKAILPIGKDINGNIYKVDLADSNNPHLIVAWQTGSGKSEFLKTSVVSLKRQGYEVAILDPKRIGMIKMKSLVDHYISGEEAIYQYLQLISLEMMNRYILLEKYMLEDIRELEELKKSNPEVAREISQMGISLERKVIIIDEFASMTKWIYGKEVMVMVEKIINEARASGIHLILATQRPDVKVISGSIKANISTRVCFALATTTDSKVVLDRTGAEKLKGKWDMLFMNTWVDGLVRLQSYYIPWEVKDEKLLKEIQEKNIERIERNLKNLKKIEEKKEINLDKLKEEMEEEEKALLNKAVKEMEKEETKEEKEVNKIVWKVSKKTKSTHKDKVEKEIEEIKNDAEFKNLFWGFR